MPAFDELLRQNTQADLLRFTTAGSVDDGKSTLIGRLLQDTKNIYDDHLASLAKDSKRLNREEVDLALLTDGLKAEREQGITIDVAYRYFSTPKRRFIIADTPGHEQYTRNMVTGASTANLAIILIDARNGVLIQSKRHGFLASLLGVPHLVVAVNKMDLVGYDEKIFEAIREEYSEFAAKLDARDLTYIPISALRGDNVVDHSSRMPWYRGTPLLDHLESVHIASDRNLIDFRFPVQLALRPSQDFRGVAGRVVSGVVRVGDEVLALPSGRRSRVTRISTFDGDLEYAFPPLSVTICLADEIDLGRGDLLVHPRNLPRREREIEAILVWMNEKPFRPNQPYLVKHTTQAVRGVCPELQYKIDPNELHRAPADRLELNEIGRIRLEVFRPLLFDEYVHNRETGSFILIDPISHATAGAGLIIERSQHRDILSPAGTEIRSANVRSEKGLVTREERACLLGQRPLTLWLTGLSGSGKSSIAKALERRLFQEGRACLILDGDNVRQGLCRDLGFSADDRTENIRRVAEVARLMNDAGLIVITAFISPYREDRDRAREIIGDAFVEIHIDAPLEVCEARDPKGLYRKARSGEIAEFTGVSAPYEAPDSPELHIHTEREGLEAATEKLLAHVRKRSEFYRD